MNKRNYKYVVYFIAITVVTTIAVQLYWNYREYQINKQNLISKVQLSLDNSVEAYFANLTTRLSLSALVSSTWVCNAAL